MGFSRKFETILFGRKKNGFKEKAVSL